MSKKKGFFSELKEKNGIEKVMFVLIKIAKWWLITGLFFALFTYSFFKVEVVNENVKKYVPRTVLNFMFEDMINAGKKK